MAALGWLKIAAVTAGAYVTYDLAPLPFPDLPADLHRIILSTLIVAFLLSGNAVMANRRAARERQRYLADAPTTAMPVKWIGRATIVRIDDSTLDGYSRGYADGLARRPMDDGGGAVRRNPRK